MQIDLRPDRRVLFLCSGNAIRSAFCELFARHLGTSLDVESAATRFRNDRMFPETRAALRERGVDAAAIETFRPRHLDELPPLPPDTLVLGMTRDHLAGFEACREETAELRLLLELLGTDQELPDPYFTGEYEATFRLLDRAIRALP